MMNRFVVLLVCIAMLTGITAYAADTAWDAEERIIRETLMIASGDTLKISPGAKVHLEADIEIEGSLIAEGVTFTGGKLLAQSGFTSVISLKNCILDGTGLEVDSAKAAGASITFEDCVITNPLNGIRLSASEIPVTFTRCDITAGAGDGVVLDGAKFASFKNCLIAKFAGCGMAIRNNSAVSANEGAPSIVNCTIASNATGVLLEKLGGANILNSIIAENGVDISGDNALTGSIVYTLARSVSGVSDAAFIKRIDKDPLFADSANGDYHLLSEGGRWKDGEWVKDKVTSPGVNAGDAKSSYKPEPEPNGDRVNIGRYGDTEEASKSLLKKKKATKKPSKSKPKATPKPEPTQSTEPEPTQSTEPEPTQSAEPEPTQSTEPEPTQSTEPGPTSIE